PSNSKAMIGLPSACNGTRRRPAPQAWISSSSEASSRPAKSATAPSSSHRLLPRNSVINDQHDLGFFFDQGGSNHGLPNRNKAAKLAGAGDLRGWLGVPHLPGSLDDPGAGRLRGRLH